MSTRISELEASINECLRAAGRLIEARARVTELEGLYHTARETWKRIQEQVKPTEDEQSYIVSAEHYLPKEP